MIDLLSRYWPAAILYCVIFALLSSYLARRKGRDQGYWFLLGLVFGVVAFAVLSFLKKMPAELSARNNLLLDETNHLRAGWRILLFLVLVLFLYYVSATIAKVSRVVPPQSYLFLFYIIVFLSTYLVVRFVDHRRFGSTGFPIHGRILKEFLLGVIIGTAMICAVAGFEFLIGAVKFIPRFNLTLLTVLKNFGVSFLMFGFLALGEELLFRGYPFQTLMEGTGPVVATISVSIVYGFLHSSSQYSGLLALVNTSLYGMCFCLAFLKTRSLYLPIGIHFSWYLVQSFFFSLPVSGLITNRTLFIPDDFGPDWLTGGRYGPDGGIGTTIVLILVIAYFLVGNSIKPAYDYAAARERLPESVKNLRK